MDEELVPEFLDLLHATFPTTPFKTTRALPYIIEIVAEGVDKSVALSYFCGKFGVKAENVMTFVSRRRRLLTPLRGAADEGCREQGDGENDVGMLTAAGFGVSMGNAMDAPRIAAEYVFPITCANSSLTRLALPATRPVLTTKEESDSSSTESSAYALLRSSLSVAYRTLTRPHLCSHPSPTPPFPSSTSNPSIRFGLPLSSRSHKLDTSRPDGRAACTHLLLHSFSPRRIAHTPLPVPRVCSYLEVEAPP
jgi:hypothetical protein